MSTLINEVFALKMMRDLNDNTGEMAPYIYGVGKCVYVDVYTLAQDKFGPFPAGSDALFELDLWDMSKVSSPDIDDREKFACYWSASRTVVRWLSMPRTPKDFVRLGQQMLGVDFSYLFAGAAVA